MLAFRYKEMKTSLYDAGHTIKMTAMPIYMYHKSPFKNHLQNHSIDFYEIGDEAAGTPTHHSCSNDDHWLTFTASLNFCNLGFSIGKREHSGFNRNFCNL